MRPRANIYLVSCEHGGNRVPRALAGYFDQSALHSHAGYDAGALSTARKLASALSAKLIYSTTSRLAVDLNRSIGHPKLHSRAIAQAGAEVAGQLLRTRYLPYREKVGDAVSTAVLAGARVVHIASHSFTPVLEGNERHADIGLLYDPARKSERRLCRLWAEHIGRLAPGLRVRKNYPYRGVSDGLTSWLRSLYPDAEYLGIELEVNQKHLKSSPAAWRALQRALIESLLAALRDFDPV